MIRRIDWWNVVIAILVGCAVFLVIGLVVFLVGFVTTDRSPDVRNEQNVSVWHVDGKNVTCFIWDGDSFNGGVDCIPDWQLSPPTN